MIFFCLKATGKSGGKSSRRGNNYNTLVSFNQNDIDVSGQILQITFLFFLTECRYNGQTYKLWQKFPAGDDCNTCTCKFRGRVSCTKKTCCKYF